MLTSGTNGGPAFDSDVTECAPPPGMGLRLPADDVKWRLEEEGPRCFPPVLLWEECSRNLRMGKKSGTVTLMPEILVLLLQVEIVCMLPRLITGATYEEIKK